MKVLNKKTAILACLSLSVAMGAVGVATLSGVKASADSPFMMEKGASLYLDELSGLKFSFTDKDYNAENPATYGMLIVPYDYITATEAAISEATEGNPMYGLQISDYVNTLNKAAAEGVIDNAPIVTEVLPDENGVFSHSVGELNEYNYVREFFGIGYKVTGENTYEYATQNDNVRSVFEVANLALNANVYDGGDLDGSGGELDEEEKKEFRNIDDNRDVVENFITTGFAFVYGNATPTASLPATYIDGEITPEVTLTPLAGKEHIQPNIHWNYAMSGNSAVVELTEDGKLKGVARGQGTVNAGLGGVMEIPATASVLKDATELQIYNDSENAYLFENVSAPVVNGTYTAQLKGGYWDDVKETSGYDDPGYLAIKNPASGDGKYTLDTNGTYVDFYFKGNNMPTVEFFGTTIESLSLGKGDDTTNTKNEPTGYVVFNGAAKADTYKRWTKLQAARKDVDTVVETDESGTPVSVLEGFESHSNYTYVLAKSRNFYRYGVSDYSDNTNKFTRANYNKDSVSDGKCFLRVADQSGPMSIWNNSTSTFSNWALTEYTDSSKFSMYSLMKEGEEQYWHYKVGLKFDSKGVPALNATLYKTDAQGNHVDADATTPDTVDAFATFTKYKTTNLSAPSSGRSGYIIVYGALKGNETNAGARYNTQLAYTMPYAGA